jgi:murein DD-endopeptidase MepM/ murein hydrolase activator NlpD
VGSHIGVELPFSRSLGYVRVTQDFGEGVTHPTGNDHGKIDARFTADRYFYYAVDFALPVGSDVLAQGHGRVISSRMTVDNGSNTSDGMGNYITVEYDGGGGAHFYATYLHLSRGSVPSTVTLGQTFAHSGNTGTIDSNGVSHAHLHVTYGLSYVDYNSSTSSVRMADGSLAGNPQGAPVFFTATDIRPANFVESRNGFLHDGDEVRSDNVNPGSEVNPVVIASNQYVQANHYDDMNGWFFASDANPGDSIEYWLIYDGNPGSHSGHFVVHGQGLILHSGRWETFGGGEVPAGELVLLTGAQMAAAQFLAGDRGQQDPLYVLTWDGHRWGDWHQFWVTSS